MKPAYSSSKKILALWSIPRSRSTAFLWMIKQRGDMKVMQEPFGRSAYSSEERIFDRLEVQPNAAYNYQSVRTKLWKKAKETPLFIKDFPYYFLHIVDEEFLSHFQHTFLIRDPAQALPSYFHKMPDLDFEECGYKELYELFEKVLKYSGAIPPVINSDDLINHPSAIVQAYCEQVGLPFDPKVLNWSSPGDTREIGWFGDRTWNDDLRVSKGFVPTKNHYVRAEDNEKLSKLYEMCKPYYDTLNQYRLKL